MTLTTRDVLAASDLGVDQQFYAWTISRFLGGGPWYLADQLTGQPYALGIMTDNLYPPTAIFLFPLTLVPVLWWGIPLTVTLACFRAWRPSAWALAGMLVLLTWPRAHAAILFGNTDMWAMAGVAAGLRWGWPAAVLWIKPTFAPLALLGVRDRRWWLLTLVPVILTLPLWPQYLVAVRDARIGWDYSLGSLPLLLLPVVGWLGRRTSVRQPQEGQARVQEVH